MISEVMSTHTLLHSKQQQQQQQQQQQLMNIHDAVFENEYMHITLLYKMLNIRSYSRVIHYIHNMYLLDSYRYELLYSVVLILMQKSFAKRTLRYALSSSSKYCSRRQLLLEDILRLRHHFPQLSSSHLFANATKTLSIRVHDIVINSLHITPIILHAQLCLGTRRHVLANATVPLHASKGGVLLQFNNLNMLNWQRSHRSFKLTLRLESADNSDNQVECRINLSHLSFKFLRDFSSTIFQAWLLAGNQRYACHIGHILLSLEWKFSLDATLQAHQHKIPREPSTRYDCVLYRYLFDSCRRFRCEKRDNYSCPWCALNCFNLIALCCHLQCSHSRFQFWYESCSNTSIIYVAVRSNDICVKSKHIHSSRRKLCVGDTSKTFLMLQGKRVAALIARRFWRVNRVSMTLKNAIGVTMMSNHTSNGYVIESIDDETVEDKPLIIENDDISHHTSHQNIDDKLDECNTSQQLVKLTPRVKTKRTLKTIDTHVTAKKHASSLKSAVCSERVYYHGSSWTPVLAEENDCNSDDEIDSCWRTSQRDTTLSLLCDATTSERRLMLLWNAFQNNKPVLYDSACADICIQFARHHATMLRVENLRTAFMLHLMAIWEFGVISIGAIDECMRLI